MENRDFYVSVLTFLTLAAVVLLVRLLSDLPDNWSEYLCEQDDCTVQDWLSATSGWVGFIAAAIGAYFVYRQLAEQRKQTAFMLGDGEPVFQVHVYAFDHTRAVLRFINWNRRTIAIRRVRIACKEVAIPNPILFRWSDKQFQEGTETNDCAITSAGWLDIVPGVEGWIDRQGRPEVFDFQLLFRNEEEDFVDLIGGLTTETLAEIVVYGRYEDGTDNDLVFKLKVPVIDFLPNTAKRIHMEEGVE